MDNKYLFFLSLVLSLERPFLSSSLLEEEEELRPLFFFSSLSPTGPVPPPIVWNKSTVTKFAQVTLNYKYIMLSTWF